MHLSYKRPVYDLKFVLDHRQPSLINAHKSESQMLAIIQILA